MNVVVLLSGGMDSVCALYHVHQSHQITAALSFDYGSKHNHKEIPCAQWHCNQLGLKHISIPLAFINQYFESTLLQSGEAIPQGHYEDDNMKQTVVPFRNGIMLAIAAGFAESHDAEALAIAAHSGDHAIYPDCRENFMAAMEEAIRCGTYANIQVLRPFIAITKTQIAQRGQELGVNFGQTWSCYEGKEIHCGACGTCIERREAFQQAHITDPTDYLETPPSERMQKSGQHTTSDNEPRTTEPQH